MYVIVRDDGAFVAPSGSASSYTRYLQKARVFPTYGAADGERCKGNEVVRSLAEVMLHNGR